MMHAWHVVKKVVQHCSQHYLVAVMTAACDNLLSHWAAIMALMKATDVQDAELCSILQSNNKIQTLHAWQHAV